MNDNGVNIESLLAAGYSEVDIRSAGQSTKDINNAISTLTAKADAISMSVMDGLVAEGGDNAGTTVEVDVDAIKAKMDEANIPTFVQVDIMLSAGSTTDGITVDLVTQLMNAGFTANDFDGTEVTKRQLVKAQAQASAGANAGGGGGSTAIAVFVGVLVVLFVVVVAAAYFCTTEGKKSNDKPPVSFENPIYNSTGPAYADDAGAGTYAEAGAFGENGGAFDGGGATGGYMDVNPLSNSAGGEESQQSSSGYMDVSGAQQGDAGTQSSGYMDVTGGQQGSEKIDNAFQQDDASDEDV